MINTVTQIPLDPANGTRQESPIIPSSRPAWIRPVRKKAPSAPRSNQSADSPSHHSSPEAFSPSDFFGAEQGTSNQMSSSSQYGGTNHTAPNPPSSFLDPSGGVAMDMIRGDAQMYMSHGDMLSLFNEGVDINHLFSSDFNMVGTSTQQQQAQTTQQQQPSSSSVGDRLNGGGNVIASGAPGYTSPGFMKMSGLATSP